MDITKAIEEERTRLTERVTVIETQITELQEEKAKIDLELKAITVYEQAKSGVKKERKARGPREKGVRASVMNMIASTPGVSRSQLLELMKAKGDKKKEQSISNVLANLKKAGTISAKDGVYSKV